MSPESKQPKRFSAKPKGQTDKDFLLQSLVTYVNRIEGASVEITLQMSGLLISGKLIAGDKYFTKLAEIFYGKQETLKDNPDLENDFEEMASGGDIYREERDFPDDTFPSPVFIHIENCRIISVNETSRYSVLWRGRISQVDGFFLGSFPSAKKEQKPDVDKKE